MANLIPHQWSDISLTLLTGAEKNLYIQMSEDPNGDSNFWRNGSILRVFFVPGGNLFQQNYVKSLLANNWELYANIKFEYVTDRRYSDIRVQLEGRDATCSSIVGNRARKVPTPENTLCIGCAPSGHYKYRFRSDQGDVLHEFGHGLGLEHERISVTTDLSDLKS
ncbi:hypothetical protein EG327_009724 [Venturia inaequalis]|uniref:Uncharacterized protein n=1 Tax=Venturia inaequalis TaxID=5025 RepID=A0A8H3VQM4_VENIN|nr:hypothetical protein EG327_009724 [Venturia inaequalis]